MRKQFLYILPLLALLAACGNQVGTNTTRTLDVVPELLYTTEEGEFRVINIDYTRQDTTYSISKWSTVGPNGGYYGEVGNDYIGQFAWTKLDPADSMPKASAVLRKYNTVNPAYNRLYERQYVYINENARPTLLNFFSTMNNRSTDMVHWNYPIQQSAARSTAWINQNTFAMLYTDQWEGFTADSDSVKPDDVPWSGKEMYIHRFDVSGFTPLHVDAVTAFDVGDFREDVRKNKPVDPWFAELLVSANNEFYIVWFPRFNRLGRTPYIIRKDGSMAYNPTQVRNKWEDRYFGASMFAMEESPTKDSVYVIGDINYREVWVVELPGQPDERFTPKISSGNGSELRRSVGQLIPGAGTADWSDYLRRRAWFMTYNNDGVRLAITHDLPNVESHLTIWNTDENVLTHYSLPDFQDYEYHTMGKPAWAVNSENQDMVYFFAADTSAGIADLFYVDTSEGSTDPSTVNYAKRVDWGKDIDFTNISSDENQTFASDILGR